MKKTNKKKKNNFSDGEKKRHWSEESGVKKNLNKIPILFLFVLFYLFFFQKVGLYGNQFLFGGIIPISIFFTFVYIFIYSLSESTELTNNVKLNKVISPMLYLVTLFYFSIVKKIDFFNSNFPYYGAFASATIFIMVFLYANSYFQPDLDVRGKRPGMTHFPVGKWIGRYSLGKSIQILFKPIAYIWHNLWKPYAMFLTHRGLGHFPVLGVWVRVLYLYLLYFIVTKFFLIIKLDIQLKVFEDWIFMFFPWSKNFLSYEFILFCLPIYLSDFGHILVDYIDSMKKGIPFCPNKIPRGILSKSLESLKNDIKKKRRKKF